MGSGVKYTPEFREAAVGKVIDGPRPVADVARELGLKPATLRGWVHRARREGRMAIEKGDK